MATEDLEKCYAAFVYRRRIRGEQSIRTREGFQRLQKRYQLPVRKSGAELATTTEDEEADRRNSLNVFFNPKISRLITETCWRLALFGGGSGNEERDCSGLDLDAEKYSNFTSRLIQWAFPELPRQKVQELVLFDWENDRKFDEQEHDRLSLEGFKVSLIDLVISCTDSTTPKCLEFLNLMARWLQHSLPPYARETPQVVKDFASATSSIKILPKPEPAPPTIVWDSIPLSTMTPCQIRPQGLYCELKAKVCTAPMVIMVLTAEENPFELVLATSSKLLLGKTKVDIHSKVTQTNALCGELKRQGLWTFSMSPKAPSILLVPGSTISRQTKALYASFRTFHGVEPQDEEIKSDKTPTEPLLTLLTSIPDQSSLRFDSKTNVCLRMERLSSRIFTMERNTRSGEAFSITLTASLLQTATSEGGTGAAAALSSAFEVRSTFAVSENYLEDPQGKDGRNLDAHTFVFIFKSGVSSKKVGLMPDHSVLPRQWFTSLSGANETKTIVFEAKQESETDKKEAKASRSSEIYQLFVFTLHGVYIEVTCNAEVPEQTRGNMDTEAHSSDSEDDDDTSCVMDTEVTSASLLKELLLLQKMRQREKTAEPLPDMVLGTQVSSTKPITTAESLRNKINLSRKDERHARVQELETAIQAKLESKPRKITPACQDPVRFDAVEAPPSPKSALEKRVHLLTTFFHEMAVPQPKLDELQGNEAEAAEAKVEEQLINGFGALFHRDEELQNALDEEKWSTHTAKIIRRRESIVTNLPRIKPIEEVISTGDQLEGKRPWTFEDYENTAQYIEQLMVDVEAHETRRKEQQNLLEEEQKREVKEQLIASWQYTQHRVDKTATRERIQDLEHKRRSQWMQSQQIRAYSAQSERPAFILPKQRFLLQECSLPSNAVWEVSTTPNQSVLVSGSIATARPTSPCQSSSNIRPQPPKRPATVSTERRNCIAVNSAAISRARVRRIRSAYSTARGEALPRREIRDIAVVLPDQEEVVAVLPLTVKDNQSEVESIDEFDTAATFTVSNRQATFDTLATVGLEESTKVKVTEKKKRKRKKKRSAVLKDVQFRSRVLELVSIAAQLQVIADEERKDAKDSKFQDYIVVEVKGKDLLFDKLKSSPRVTTQISAMKISRASAFFLALRTINAEFVYYDFNGTTGLVLNGKAATSSCVPFEPTKYSKFAGADDPREATVDVILTEQLEGIRLETRDTENHLTSGRIAVEKAMLGHRDSFEASEEVNRCPVRLRLTASQPHQVSSVWYAQQLPVLQGFETRFTFQVTDQSRRCFEVKDQNFGLREYRSCAVHGGDGFAFVLHSHENRTATLGGQSSSMGFTGLKNSLAIEFDSWFNDERSGGEDVFYDHVAIYSRGQSSNADTERARISAAAVQDLADGKVHAVKIRYYPELKYNYVPYFSATANLPKFIKDISEGRRVGTLLVFMDDGIANDKPILAIPINLAATLRLESDEAFVGFTASTSSSWQKHDLLGWYYCTEPPCLDQYDTEMAFDFDYNEQSMLSTTSYGNTLYPIFIYPNTASWATRQAYFAANQKIGLVS